MINEDGALGEIMVGRGNQSAHRKPIPVSFCPPKIPHNFTQAAASKSQ
jgi:hypothetical protein